jgi:hypothetical protein
MGFCPVKHFFVQKKLIFAKKNRKKWGKYKIWDFFYLFDRTKKIIFFFDQTNHKNPKICIFSTFFHFSVSKKIKNFQIFFHFFQIFSSFFSKNLFMSRQKNFDRTKPHLSTSLVHPTTQVPRRAV